MSDAWILLYVAVLFFVLSPGVLVSLPSGGSKLTVAAVHALVFAIVFHFTHKFVAKASKKVGFHNLEGFSNSEPDKLFSNNFLSGAGAYSSSKMM